MKLVIEIPEKYYNLIKGQVTIGITNPLKICIANGAPLPKGHGRLIDADKLKKHKYHDSDRHENAVSVAQIDWQPTIIEADTAESEEV